MSEFNLTAFVERIEEAFIEKRGQNDWLVAYESDIMDYYREQIAATDAVSAYEFYSHVQLPLDLDVKKYLMDTFRCRRTSEIMAANDLLKEVIGYYVNREDFNVVQTVQKYEKLGPILTRYFISIFTDVTEELKQRESVSTGLQVLRVIEQMGSDRKVPFSAEDIEWYKNPQNVAVS